MRQPDCRMDHFHGVAYEKECCSVLLATASLSVRVLAMLGIRVATLVASRPDWRFVAFFVAPSGRHNHIYSDQGTRYQTANLVAAGQVQARDSIDVSPLRNPRP